MISQFHGVYRGQDTKTKAEAGGGHGNPLQYSFLENPHEQRYLAGDSPWGFKESDMTERQSTRQPLPLISHKAGTAKANYLNIKMG